MKMIQAIIKPFKVDEVKEALNALNITGMTVTEVKGFGRQKGQKEMYRGAEYEMEFVSKAQITVVVTGDIANAVVQAIVESAKTGSIGDGKVFVTSVEQAVRIRTGETGTEAL